MPAFPLLSPPRPLFRTHCLSFLQIALGACLLALFSMCLWFVRVTVAQRRRQIFLEMQWAANQPPVMTVDDIASLPSEPYKVPRVCAWPCSFLFPSPLACVYLPSASEACLPTVVCCWLVPSAQTSCFPKGSGVVRGAGGGALHVTFHSYVHRAPCLPREGLRASPSPQPWEACALMLIKPWLSAVVARRGAFPQSPAHAAAGPSLGRCRRRARDLLRVPHGL